MHFWPECVPGSGWDTLDTKEVFVNNQVSESHLATCPAVSGGAWWEGLDEPPVPRTKACLGRLENQGGKADMRQWAAQTPVNLIMSCCLGHKMPSCSYLIHQEAP